MVDFGTHAELEARCPLYRLLLAGPGDDAEAGAGREPACGTVTCRPAAERAAWPADLDAADDRRWRRSAAAATAGGRSGGRGDLGPGASWRRAPCRARPGRPAGSGPAGAAAGAAADGGGMGSMMAGMPATPELLARVAALPPATDQPDVDPAGPAPRPRISACARCCARSPSACSSAWSWTRWTRWPASPCPRWSAAASTMASKPALFRAVALDLGRRAGVVAGRLGDQRGADPGHRAERRARALHAAGEDLRPAAAARAGLLRAGDGRPDHDPDDHGRGRALDVPADRPAPPWSARGCPSSAC